MGRYQPPPDKKEVERLLDTYKSVCLFELERGEKITGRAPIVFGIYSVLLGGLAFILNNFPRPPDVWTVEVMSWYILFWLFFIIDIVLIVISCHWARKFLFVDGYAYIDPIELHDGIYSQDIMLKPAMPVMTEPDLTNFILGRYIQSASANFVENTNKDFYYGKTLGWLMKAVVAAALCLMAYFAFRYAEKNLQIIPERNFRYVKGDTHATS